MVAQDGPDRWRLVLLDLPSAGRCRPGDNRGSEDVTESDRIRRIAEAAPTLGPDGECGAPPPTSAWVLPSRSTAGGHPAVG